VPNRFYNDFDTEIHGRRNPDYRSPFQQDRDRVIYTSAFRRLQAKTQVFSVGEYDFYRTRLTHSIEVAQIGRSICGFLLEHDEHQSNDFYIDPHLVEAACLAHDIGHPPFGHAGERALHGLMRTFGGFEGNAQTLRLLTEIIYSRGNARTGLRPTRALLDATMKYKSIYCDLGEPQNHFLYDEQAPLVAYVFGDESPTEDLAPGEALNHFRSIECQIMDWADDTAYSLNDLIDGIRAGFLTPQRIRSWAEKTELDEAGGEAVDFILDMIERGDFELTMSVEIGNSIRACRLVPGECFLSERTNRYRFQLEVDEELRARSDWFGRLAQDLVFQTAELQQLEFKGRKLLEQLFGSYREMYLEMETPTLSLLPERREEIVLAEPDPRLRARLLCDYIAGMTDGFAIRTYKRLSDPEFGSIVDII
jgi:dGTPase